MPAAGCQPIRPPGQFFQPLALLQRHQHRQGSTRVHQLVPLQRDLRPEGGQRFDTLPVRGHVPGHRAGSGAHIATCWGATATAASYHFTYRWVSERWDGGKIEWRSWSCYGVNTVVYYKGFKMTALHFLPFIRDVGAAEGQHLADGFPGLNRFPAAPCTRALVWTQRHGRWRGKREGP